jgi:hypothetical protein
MKVRGLLTLLIFFSFFAGLSTQSAASGKDYPKAEELPGQDFEVETAKLITWDTTPNDPGHFEFDTSYNFLGGNKAWSTDVNRRSRELVTTHQFEELVFLGIAKNVDLFVGDGFSIQTDKQNNVDEFAGMLDPVTGEQVPDTTQGPSHGHGLKDMQTGLRWRFYHNESNELGLAYVPLFQIPIGRLGKYEHLAPGQGFTTMDNRLVVTKNFGRASFSANLAYRAPFSNLKKTHNYCGTFNTNIAGGYQIKPWLQPEMEILYNQDFKKNGKGTKLVTMVLGAIVTVNSHLRFDAGLMQDVLGSDVSQTTGGYFRWVVFT